MLENKLTTLQSLVVSTKAASEGSWQVIKSLLYLIIFTFTFADDYCYAACLVKDSVQHLVNFM